MVFVTRIRITVLQTLSHHEGLNCQAFRFSLTSPKSAVHSRCLRSSKATQLYELYYRAVTAIRGYYKERRDGPWERDGSLGEARPRRRLGGSVFTMRVLLVALIRCLWPFWSSIAVLQDAGESSFIFWPEIVLQGEHRGERAVAGGTRPSHTATVAGAEPARGLSPYKALKTDIGGARRGHISPGAVLSCDSAGTPRKMFPLAVTPHSCPSRHTALTVLGTFRNLILPPCHTASSLWTRTRPSFVQRAALHIHGDADEMISHRYRCQEVAS